jgi:hypothetical protein
MKKVFNRKVSKSQAVYLKALQDRPYGTPFQEIFRKANHAQANQIIKEGCYLNQQ